MKRSDFPAVQLAASAAARDGQRLYRRLTGATLAAAITAAVLGVVWGLTHESLVSYALVVIIAAALVGRLLNRRLRPEKAWFDGRAVAESMKTATWLYVCRAAPFESDPADDTFLGRVREVLKERDRLRLETKPGDELITAEMRRLRSTPLADRRAAFLADRVDDQIRYYAKSTKRNDRGGTVAYGAGVAADVALLGAAVLWAFGGGPNTIGIWTAASAAIIAWAQLSQYDELAQAYALTLRELGLAKAKVEAATNEAAFAAAVGDTEDTISREHTMWAIKHGTKP